MKLVTFIHQDQQRIGAVEDAGRIVDLERAYGTYLPEDLCNAHEDEAAAEVLGSAMCEFFRECEKALTAQLKALPDGIAKLPDVDEKVTHARARVRATAPVQCSAALTAARK